MVVIKKPIRFAWDKGNQEKNWAKHKVTTEECEEIFFDEKKQEYPDSEHSGDKEIRKIVVGVTKSGRLLLVIYTIRNNKVRVISARDLNKRKEKRLYEKAT